MKEDKDLHEMFEKMLQDAGIEKIKGEKDILENFENLIEESEIESKYRDYVIKRFKGLKENLNPNNASHGDRFNNFANILYHSAILRLEIKCLLETPHTHLVCSDQEKEVICKLLDDTKDMAIKFSGLNLVDFVIQNPFNTEIKSVDEINKNKFYLATLTTRMIRTFCDRFIDIDEKIVETLKDRWNNEQRN